jgi:hypothetical protein
MMETEQKAGPDWEKIEHVIECPLCEYNLRGLSQPRCPECGYAFTWDEIFDKSRRLHPYLFEHHPERNVWSFVWTVIGGLWPNGFWTTLHPAQPSRRKRLLLYLMIVVLVAALPMVIDVIWRIPPTPTAFSVTDRNRLAWRLDLHFPMNILHRPFLATARQLLVAGFVASLSLLLLNYALLMIFQQTMRKAQLRTHHVQRCIVYSADVLLWPALLLSAMVVVNVMPGNVDWWSEDIAWAELLTFPLIWLGIAVRLIAAYRFYLRFDHPTGTILSVQLIIFLLLALILYNLL